MSAAHAHASPAPAQAPLMAAKVTLGISRSNWEVLMLARRLPTAASTDGRRPEPEPPPPPPPPPAIPWRSPPAQKARPVPVKITALTSRSPAAVSNASSAPASSSPFMVFMRSGRLRVMVATPASTSYRTNSLIPLLLAPVGGSLRRRPSDPRSVRFPVGRPQLPLEDLARRRAGNVDHAHEGAGDLVAGEVLAGELDKLFVAHRLTRTLGDHSVHGLAPLLAGDAEHGGVGHGGMGHQHRLDLRRVDVDAPGDDHVGLAVADVVEALLVAVGDVPDRQVLPPPAPLELVVVLVVGREGATGADEELARLMGRLDQVAVVVVQAEVHQGGGPPAAAGLAHLVLGRQHGVHTELGRSVDLPQRVGPESLDVSALQLERPRGGVGDHPGQRRGVVAPDHLGPEVEYPPNRRRRREGGDRK